jgi:2-octaprenyl-6-methoxyphenol hydroxylase
MSGQTAQRFDVVIAGGGMVGASLALALADVGRDVLLIEAQPPESDAQPSFDERTTALGNGARRIFETLGVWEQIAREAAAIRQIHVSDAGHFGFARLDASEHALNAFGYTVSNRHLGRVLWEALRARPQVRLWSPARVTAAQLLPEHALLSVEREGQPLLLQARLAVAADGAYSLIKQAAHIASTARDYEQIALAANVRTDCPAHGIAYERFSGTGPLALLPRMDGSYAMIWTLPPSRAAELLACPEPQFIASWQRQFGWRAGRLLQVGRRASYPLSLVHAESSVGVRAALVGNAAQALHPVAAQGFNLGLRDAAVLAELIASAPDPGAEAVLQQYAQHRASDRRGMIGFTDRLVRLFADQRRFVGVMRDVGLLLFDLTPPAKQALSRLSWGFGTLPRLSRGLSLPRAR